MLPGPEQGHKSPHRGPRGVHGFELRVWACVEGMAARLLLNISEHSHLSVDLFPRKISKGPLLDGKAKAAAKNFLLK